jgi:hypothetical protein
MAALAGEVKLGDDVTAGIQTHAEFDVRPFGYRVTWINWDSYFRDSDLRLGDRILGVGDERYTRETHISAMRSATTPRTGIGRTGAPRTATRSL